MIIQCPEELSCMHDFTRKDTKKVFLAGGISGCPNWQEEAARKLDPHMIVFNPRRPHDIVLKDEHQISWEHFYLRQANIILFWFPKETLCPITLFELGFWLGQDKKIAIGIEPGYQREQDILIQTRLVRKVSIDSSLNALLSVVQWLNIYE